jgi:hypothetical protein
MRVSSNACSRISLLPCACRMLFFVSFFDSLPLAMPSSFLGGLLCADATASMDHRKMELGYSKNKRETGDSDDDEDDWLQAELTLRHAAAAHRFPSPDLDAETVALLICRSLQWIDYPTPGAGLERCFDFFTFECRSRVTARQGAQTVERFCEYGNLAPALQPFIGARRIVVGSGDDVTFTKEQPPLRGALASFPVVIHGANILALQYASGMNRTGVAAAPPITNMVVRLEQQRRPPNQGCWLVREILDARHAFAGDMGNAHVGG